MLAYEKLLYKSLAKTFSHTDAPWSVVYVPICLLPTDELGSGGCKFSDRTTSLPAKYHSPGLAFCPSRCGV